MLAKTNISKDNLFHLTKLPDFMSYHFQSYVGWVGLSWVSKCPPQSERGKVERHSTKW